MNIFFHTNTWPRLYLMKPNRIFKQKNNNKQITYAKK